jgi:hypothetical protein
MMRSVRRLWMIVLVGCGTSGDVGSSCHTGADCAQGLGCAGPDDGPVCGIGPMQQCASDNDCPGARCHAVFDACSADGIGSMCGPACTSDAQCGTGFACPSGACVAVLCNAGATCAARQVCDPSRITAQTPIYDRTSGCFDVACTADADCGSRPCVNGICQDGLGQCEKPMLVP